MEKSAPPEVLLVVKPVPAIMLIDEENDTLMPIIISFAFDVDQLAVRGWLLFPVVAEPVPSCVQETPEYCATVIVRKGPAPENVIVAVAVPVPAAIAQKENPFKTAALKAEDIRV